MSVGPRADFSCASCARQQGVPEVIYQDLPVIAQRCPVCGKRRGFRRLFNAVQVSTRGHAAARVIDEVLGPQMETYRRTKDAVRQFEAQGQELLDRAWQVASPEQREQLSAHAKDIRGQFAPAASIFASIPADARRDSAQYVAPGLRRVVVPQWCGGPAS